MSSTREPDDESQLLAPLGTLATVAHGRDSYYRALATFPDEMLRVGAWSVLLDSGVVEDRDHAAIFQLCHCGAVRRRAFAYYRGVADSARALAVARVDLSDKSDVEQAMMIATEGGDPAALRDAHAARFLLDGELKAIRLAAEAANAAGGWREAVTWHVRAVALNPSDFDGAASLAYLLEDANQLQLLEACLSLLEQVPRLRPVVDLFRASSRLAAGDAAQCLADIEALDERGRTSDQKFSTGSLGAKLKARALEQLGRYPDAFRQYGTMNQLDAALFPKPSLYIERIKAANAIKVEPLPATGRSNTVMMLGFPRSGTTLLENALAAHRRIETFEEITSLETAIAYLDKGYRKAGADQGKRYEIAAQARDRYFAEIDRRAKKPGVTVSIDKMPIRSLYSPLMAKLLPEQRYIFSIRHPYDVALSCFKQRFKPNGAMSSFLSFADTVQLYDFAMTTWFKDHSLDDPLVHYVRYNQLVTNFEEKVRKTLTFLGLDWDAAVLDFAEHAAARGTKTPSYRKVRQGLSIGVQTYWKDYSFAFKQRDAAPLTKWAKFFGYDTV